MEHDERAPLISDESVCITFPCSECGDHLESQAQLTSHMKDRHDKVHETPFKCRECNKAAPTKETMRQHIREEHFVTSETIISRMTASDDEGALRCQACGALFPCKANLIRHMNRYHSTDPDAAKSSRLTSSITRNPPSSSTIDVQPVMIHDGTSKPVVTNNEVKNKTSTVQPLPKAPFQCPFNCKLTFGDKLALQQHVRLGVHHRPHVPAGTRSSTLVVKCHVCGFKVTPTHRCNSGDKLLPSNGAKSANRPLYCRFCQKMFTDQQRLNIHYLTSHASKCTQEDIVGMNNGVMKTKPTTSKSNKCIRCDEVFSTSEELATHWGEKHQKKVTQIAGDQPVEKLPAPGKPAEGSKEAQTEKALINEASSRANQQRKISKCPFCLAMFVCPKRRMQHVLFGNHRFRCEECDVDFLNLNSKNEHELMKHGGQRVTEAVVEGERQAKRPRGIASSPSEISEKRDTIG